MRRQVCSEGYAKWAKRNGALPKRNACKYRITNMHPSGMRFRIQWAIWVVAFRWNAQYWHIYCRHFEKIPFRFAPLHLFCIPDYTHQIPNGISSHLLRDNLYIISTKNSKAVVWNESNTRLSASTISNIEYLLTYWSGRGMRRCLGGQVCVGLQSQS